MRMIDMVAGVLLVADDRHGCWSASGCWIGLFVGVLLVTGDRHGCWSASGCVMGVFKQVNAFCASNSAQTGVFSRFAAKTTANFFITSLFGRNVPYLLHFLQLLPNETV
ncbi:hypothetical protein ASG93_22850 [Paenibacillus sp. Soil787]|nr:hypothetical protein ASG93_22850 [Paenibacillus sp. Soil787]